MLTVTCRCELRVNQNCAKLRNRHVIGHMPIHNPFYAHSCKAWEFFWNPQFSNLKINIILENSAGVTKIFATLKSLAFLNQCCVSLNEMLRVYLQDVQYIILVGFGYGLVWGNCQENLFVLRFWEIWRGHERNFQDWFIPRDIVSDWTSFSFFILYLAFGSSTMRIFCWRTCSEIMSQNCCSICFF